MFKKYLTILAFFFLVLASSNAQSFMKIEKTGGFARLRAMGNNPYVIDPFNMTINSAWAGYYGNFIMGDLGSTNTAFGNDGTGQYIGANFQVSRNLTVAAFLTRTDFSGTFSIMNLDPYGVVNTINNLVGGGAVIGLNNNVALMASYSLGKNKFGFGFSYAGTSNEFNPANGDPTTGSASQIGLNFGYVGQLSSSILLEASVSLSLPSASYEQPNTPTTSVSQTVIGFNARSFLRLSQKFRLVPTLQFVSQSGSQETPNGTGGVDKTDGNSTSIFILGVGFMYQYGDFMFSGGPAYVSQSVTTPAIDNVQPETSNGFSGFPIWNMGGEFSFADWIVGRVGYMAVSGSFSNETPASATDVNETITTFYGPTGFWLGIGLRAAGFSLDATVNDDVLRQGFNNIGGGGATFAYISLSVAF